MFVLKQSILFKIWKFPQLSETFIVNQMVLAIKMGFEVKILVGELFEISNNANINLFEEFNLSEKIIIEDYRIPLTKSKRIIKASRLLLKNIFLFPHLVKYYKDSGKSGLLPLYEFFFYKPYRDFDTIHIQFGTNKHPVDIMKKTGYINSRIIVSFHGHDLYFPINNRIHNNGYYNRLFETADFLVANTAFLKEKLLALNAPKEKIEIIPVPVNTKIFNPYKAKNIHTKLRLVTVGRLDELKGQKYGIQAVKHLLNKGFRVEYTIAGIGVKEGELKNLVEELNLSKQVSFKGKVSPSMVSHLLKNSDIFLMTSVTNSEGMEESQGLVVAEAQACGLPVVAFDTGGVKYTLIDGKTGFLCKEKNIDAFSEKIQLLYENFELRKKMSENAVTFVKSYYSENSVIKKWEKVYG